MCSLWSFVWMPQQCHVPVIKNDNPRCIKYLILQKRNSKIMKYAQIFFISCILWTLDTIKQLWMVNFKVGIARTRLFYGCKDAIMSRLFWQVVSMYDHRKFSFHDNMIPPPPQLLSIHRASLCLSIVILLFNECSMMGSIFLYRGHESLGHLLLLLLAEWYGDL